MQGRVLTGIHIWGSGGKGSKPAVVFHGTVHAREWISTMVGDTNSNPRFDFFIDQPDSQTAEYQAWQLLTKYSTDATVKALVDKFDFYITPIVNPDGQNHFLWRLFSAILTFVQASYTHKPLTAFGGRIARR